MLLCLWSRFCLAELIWYLLHGQREKSGSKNFRNSDREDRRDHNSSVVSNGSRRSAELFSPWFHLQSRSAVGLFVPPSYMEEWIRKHKKFLAQWNPWIDVFAEWPVLRDIGDHVLLEFVRCKA